MPGDVLPVRAIPPRDVDFLAENNGRERDFSDIAPSLDTNGQTFPGMVCPNPNPGKPLLCLDGNRRLAWCLSRDREFMALVLDKPVSRSEALRIKHTSDLKKKLTLDQIAEDAAALLDEGMTQAEAARLLDRSEATISRALSLSLFPEDERKALLEKGVCHSSLSVIAPLCGEQKAKAISFATTPGPDGKPRKRDELVLFIKRMKGDKEKRAKQVSFTVGRRKLVVQSLKDDNAGALIEDLKALIDRLRRFPDTPPEGWQYLPG
ncbi:helix-turn-helix domain-containing protein [Tautonia rosea]|uniref:helix-turn-helix domain-containing protein n=1 Tax=Tautonia rosea TaxID=2728037 RepID=UPI0014737B84|nr:helix-turn-helix domain-containing protein [Tautonia rosea]